MLKSWNLSLRIIFNDFLPLNKVLRKKAKMSPKIFLFYNLFIYKSWILIDFLINHATTEHHHHSTISHIFPHMSPPMKIHIKQIKIKRIEHPNKTKQLLNEWWNMNDGIYRQTRKIGWMIFQQVLDQFHFNGIIEKSIHVTSICRDSFQFLKICANYDDDEAGIL